MEYEGKISFPVVLKKKTITYKSIIGLCALLWLITLIFHYEGSYLKETLFFVSASTSIAASLFIDIRSLRIKEFKTIGKITLTQDECTLEIDNSIQKFKSQDLQNLELTINETSRDPKGWMEGIWGINKLKDGIKNSISFTTRTNEYYLIKIFVRDILTIDSLDIFLKHYNTPFQLKRKNKAIKSIKTEHYMDYPPEYVNTKSRQA